MKKSISILLLSIVFSILFSQCEKEEKIIHNVPIISEETIIDPDSNQIKLSVDSCLLLPIGQLLEKGSDIEIRINDSLFSFEVLIDGLGGNWAILPYKAFPDESELKFRIIKRKTEPILLSLENDTTPSYLKSSRMINWKSNSIKAASSSVFNSELSTIQNAILLQQKTQEILEFDAEAYNYYGGFTALYTFQDKKGVCINFSRLFIALCRASGIKARSVSGVIYQTGAVGTDCFHHHQWCEFLDDDNQWRSIDLTYTSNIDIDQNEYIDFIYSAEECEMLAPWYTQYMNDPGMPFKTNNEVMVIWAYLPYKNHARFGFELISFSPNEIVLEKSVFLKKRNDCLIIPEEY